MLAGEKGQQTHGLSPLKDSCLLRQILSGSTGQSHGQMQGRKWSGGLAKRGN